MARTAASRAVPEETSACGEVPSYDADAGTPPRGRGRRESARAPGPLLHLAGTRGGGLRRWRRRRRPPGDRQYDVVITDVLMPGANGLDVMRAAKAADRFVEVIFLTGAPDLSTAVKALR